MRVEEIYQILLKAIARTRLLQHPLMPVINRMDEAELDVAGVVNHGVINEESPLLNDNGNLNESHLTRARFIDSFFNGYYFARNKLLPPAFLGLIALDLYNYYTHPRNVNYDNSPPNILSGLSRNETVWSNNLGSSNPEDYFRYWFGIGLVLGLPFAFGTVNLLKHVIADQIYNLNEFADLLLALALEPSKLGFNLRVDRVWNAFNKAKLELLCNRQLDDVQRNRLYTEIEGAINRSPAITVGAMDILADIAHFQNLPNNNLLHNRSQDPTFTMSRWYANYKLWELG